MKTGDYCSGVALFKEKNGSGCTFIKGFPDTLNTDKDFELIYLNALNYAEESCIYAFTIPENRICYALTFMYENEHYTIIIISTKFIPYLYDSFLQDTQEIFSNSMQNIEWEFIKPGSSIVEILRCIDLSKEALSKKDKEVVV